MQLKLTWQYALAFMAFVFVFGQLHGVMHLVNARSICGVPGTQIDFNLWTASDSCAGNPQVWMATLFGPVFSYIIMWVGFFMLLSKNKNLWAAGFVLALGNLPFARIFTAAMGGGDETTVLKTLLMPGVEVLMVKVIGFVSVFALAFPPLYMAFKRLQNENRFYMIAGFCILPLIIMWAYEFKLLGLVLQAGFFATRHYLGIPDFIWYHTSLMLVIVLFYSKRLFKAGE